MSYSAKKHIKNVTNLIDYSASAQSISTTLTAYNGTELTYTPSNNASNVVIEVNISLSFMPDINQTLANTRLQESTDGGSTWADLDGFKLFDFLVVGPHLSCNLLHGRNGFCPGCSGCFACFKTCLWFK